VAGPPALQREVRRDVHRNAGVNVKKLAFLAGLIVGVLLIPAGAYLYFAGGYAPVATGAAPIPFEKMLARKALHARLAKEMPKTVPIEPTEANLLGGAALYKEQCAVCHGLPGAAKTAIAAGMFPKPPQLFQGKGVTDDEPGETYWKVANGIRLTGMPGFGSTLKDDQLWQVSLLLANADKLSEAVKHTPSPN
jgi:thiosulfate dehydrogenase